MDCTLDQSQLNLPFLSSLMLATANLLAIRRLLSRSIALAHTSATPGPPLPPSHPSPSLLAKLNLHVYTLLDSARSLCKAAHKSSSSSIGEVTPDLRRVLSDGRSLAQARSYKWLGVDCGENGGRAKAGEAVGWLTLAKATLDEVAGKNEGFRKLKVNKGKKVGQAGKDAVAREADSVAVFLHAYKKVNDTVSQACFRWSCRYLCSSRQGVFAVAAPLHACPACCDASNGCPCRAGRAERQGVHSATTCVQAPLFIRLRRNQPSLAQRSSVRRTQPGGRQR